MRNFLILLHRKLRDKKNVASEDKIAASIDIIDPYNPPHRAPAIKVIGEQGKNKIARRICTIINTNGAINGQFKSTELRRYERESVNSVKLIPIKSKQEISS